MKTISTLTLLFLVSAACTTPNQHRDRQPAMGRKPLAENIKLHLITTTDLHGYLLPQTNAKQIQTGGVEMTSGYFKIAKKEDPETLFVDAGDLFQGTIISNDSEGTPVVKFYNYVGYDAAAVGNHEFDFGPKGPNTIVRKPKEDPLGALKARIKKADFAFLGANICAVSEDPEKCKNPQNYQVASFTKPYLIKKVQGVKVGVIGVSTTVTPTTTMPQNVSDLRFFSIETALEKYIPEMKTEGAKVIFVVAHSGGFCKKDTQGVETCNPKDELFATIDKLSESTRKSISAILGGHTHTWINTLYNGTRVMITGRYGQSFGYLTMNYDTKNDLATVESSQNIDICHKVFSDSKGCGGGKGELIQPTFLGEEVKPDAQASRVIAKEAKAAQTKMEVVVGKTLAPLKKGGRESTMGNFMADTLRLCGADAKCQGAGDIGLQNNGGIRAELPVGAITFGQVFQVMPFDNYVATMKLTGTQVNDLLVLWYNYENSWQQTSGLEITIDMSMKETRTMTNSVGETQTLPNYIRDIKVNGEALDPNKTYTVVLADFLAAGGGGLGYIVKGLNPPPTVNYERKFRDALVDMFKSKPEGVTYEGAKPRYIDVTPKP